MGVCPGEAADNGVARAAVGQVVKGVVVAIVGIGHVRGTCLAHSLIRRDGDRGRTLLLARFNSKLAMKLAIEVGDHEQGQFPAR